MYKMNGALPALTVTSIVRSVIQALLGMFPEDIGCNAEAAPNAEFIIPVCLLKVPVAAIAAADTGKADSVNNIAQIRRTDKSRFVIDGSP
jgi:hypothetical protein